MRHAAAAVLLLIVSWSVSAAEPPAWVKESNAHAKVLLDVLVRFSPESATYYGVEGHDDQVADLRPKIYQRSQEATEEAIETLEERLEDARDPKVRQDLEILIQAARDNHRSAELRHEHMVPYFAVSRLVFGGIRALLDPRISKERQALAVKRLNRYAGLERGSQPIARLARERTEERLRDKKLVRPYRDEIEQHLADTPRLVAGLKALFEKSGLKGYEPGLAALEQQLLEYDRWVRETLLPQARTDHRLPPEIYADNLRQYGVDIEPEALVERALIGFGEVQAELRSLAPLVAREKKLKSGDYRDVIRALKKRQVSGDAILPLYQRRLAAIEKIIRREDLVTLPQREAVIRLASEAESAMSPAPNMRPPRLIGNTGEYGEFVLPLNVPGKEGEQSLRMDDFTFDAAAWTLTAHEARPGHELQFSAIVEKGISTARAIFAFNSVNVEGWALYAEAQMKPYLPLEGQLIALQHRLMRAARAFLDPMVNTGRMSPEAAEAFLMEEVVLSEAMARQEVNRYSFRSPGQATAYFHGYQRLMEIRQRAELALRERFDRKAFHDFVLAQGMLPPRLLEKAVMEEFVPRYRT